MYKTKVKKSDVKPRHTILEQYYELRNYHTLITPSHQKTEKSFICLIFGIFFGAWIVLIIIDKPTVDSTPEILKNTTKISYDNINNTATTTTSTTLLKSSTSKFKRAKMPRVTLKLRENETIPKMYLEVGITSYKKGNITTSVLANDLSLEGLIFKTPEGTIIPWNEKWPFSKSSSSPSSPSSSSYGNFKVNNKKKLISYLIKIADRNKLVL